MRATPSPYNLQSCRKTSKQHGRSQSRPFINYIRKLAGVFAIFSFRRKKPSETVTRSSNSDNRVGGIPSSTGNSSQNSSGFKFSSSYSSSSYRSGPIGTLAFSIEEIFKATANFSSANKIGEGGFGIVYKGKLMDGSLVAVKRAKKNNYDKHVAMEFKNEILTLSKIEHLNLVKLHGYVEHGDERLIVVEYVGNGTLREHLDGVQGIGLEVAQRLDIAIDVAHAITYLHMYSDPPIIHRDIKSSNILITEKLRAKVADFGFARLTTEDLGVTHISTQIKGTTGTPIDQKRPSKERVTTRWAMQKLKEKEAILAMDPMLRRSPSSNMVVEKVLELASRCLSSDRQSRPSMKECAELLWKIRKDFKETSSFPYATHQSANFPQRNAKKSREQTFGIQDGEMYKFISA
ncbi:calmodulin-binding receptor-like cytoplasmic kinase 1 [Euphorbia peplus]|nr:calmodulin-binding receptor-like cytoplasmic kinase 1 [Euphorbia peplus]